MPSSTADLIPLKLALYGPDGLYPDVTRANVQAKVGPIIRKRASRHSRYRVEWLRAADVEAAKT